MADPFVPDEFDPPTSLDHPAFRLLPLGPEHNEADYEAWTTSADHIRRTPGFEGREWPTEMTSEENLGDLVGHAADFGARRGFTYTVRSPSDRTIGCVYIYPSTDDGVDVSIRSWVTADCAELDVVLHDAVSEWIASDWPFTTVAYAPRVY